MNYIHPLSYKKFGIEIYFSYTTVFHIDNSILTYQTFSSHRFAGYRAQETFGKFLNSHPLEEEILKFFVCYAQQSNVISET